MGLIRWQNVLFALLPGIDALTILARSRRTRDTRALRDATIGSAVFLVCLVVGFLPQMLAWKSMYGTFIARSPVGPQIRWSDPHLVDILWSARNGLFSTTPMLYLGAIGLTIFAFSRPAVGVPALLSIARDGLFQRVHPGLVGQCGVWRTPLRRDDPALCARPCGVRRRHHATGAPARDRRGLRAACCARRVERGADGRRAGGRRPHRRNARIRSRVGLAGARRARLVRQPLHLPGEPDLCASQRRLAR